jgi:hypothetical protein
MSYNNEAMVAVYHEIKQGRKNAKADRFEDTDWGAIANKMAIILSENMGAVVRSICADNSFILFEVIKDRNVSSMSMKIKFN